MPALMQCRYRAAFAVAATCFMAAMTSAAAADSPPKESKQEYWAQIDQRDWDAAIAAAQKLVSAARETESTQPLAVAEAVTLLGNAQLGKTDYVSAEASFVEALRIVEQNSTGMNAALLEPLRGLGYTFAASGRHDAAIAPLDRALLVARRSYGLFDISQQGILRQLATSLTKSGRAAEAEKHMQYLLRVGERKYGRGDPRLAPLMCIVGDWYISTGLFEPARVAYRTALDIVERRLGKDDLAAVEPLRGLAGSYRQELYLSTLGLKTTPKELPNEANGQANNYRVLEPRTLSEVGEESLLRALSILEANPNASRNTLIDTLLETGDWFQVKHQPDKALPFYRRAAAAAAAGQKEPGAPPLSFPVRVYYPTPALARRNLSLSPEQVDERFVQVEFTVTGRGDVTNARVIDQNGTARQASETLQAIRAARFRPKFVNGEPAETIGMTAREVFRMRKEIEEEDKDEKKES